LGVAGAIADVVAGTTLRAIGRGLGSGTFAGAATANPATRMRLVAKAVDRSAAARTDRVTAFPDGESLDVMRP
jgi:hypothetical protein